MKTLKIKLLSFAFLFTLIININAQSINTSEPPESSYRNSINMCPFGIAFGIYSVNFEHLITPYNGLVLRADYEAIPNSYSSANIESFGYSFTINYRYHFAGEMNSCYLGAYSRFRTFEGEGKSGSTNFNFTRYDMTYGLNAGKKWVWASGLNINFSLGYGFSNDWKNVSATGDEIDKAIKDYENGYDFMSPFYGELSIGYTF